MSLRSKTGRLAVLIVAVALVPPLALAQTVAPGAPTMLVVGPAACGRPLRGRLGSATPEAYLAGLVLRNGEVSVGSGHCR